MSSSNWPSSFVSVSVSFSSVFVNFGSLADLRKVAKVDSAVGISRASQLADRLKLSGGAFRVGGVNN